MFEISEKVSFNIASEAYNQTELPDRSILFGQKLVKDANIKTSNATF